MPDKDKIKKLFEEINKLDSQVLEAYYDEYDWPSIADEENHTKYNILCAIYCLNEKLNKVIELVKEVINHE